MKIKANSNPHVLVLDGNFAGLTTARFISGRCKDAVRITLVDRKPYLAFIPNIPIEVFANHDSTETLHMPIVGVLERDDIRFVQGEVGELDVKKGWVAYTPTERQGAAPERIEYDYLVMVLGTRLAYDKFEGFGQYGHNPIRHLLREQVEGLSFLGGYKGGLNVIGSTLF